MTTRPWESALSELAPATNMRAKSRVGRAVRGWLWSLAAKASNSACGNT